MVDADPGFAVTRIVAKHQTSARYSPPSTIATTGCRRQPDPASARAETDQKVGADVGILAQRFHESRTCLPDLVI
ncbi:MAG: hypothetical protein KDI37_00455 [Xanthomonadales bacterium]|nr:hypothetical protein [Xanthomonadales bacterium]MCB1640175.1 hypothetical protein [Xanthomonadales bacterium]